MGDLRVELQDAVERLWPDYCGGCGRPAHQAGFEVEVGHSSKGNPYIAYTCGECGIGTFANREAIEDDSVEFGSHYTP